MKAIQLLTEDQMITINNINPTLLILLEQEEVNSDDENSPQDDKKQEQEQDSNQGQEEQQPLPSPEEIRSMEIMGAEQKFTQGVLYDSLAEISSKIELLLDVFYNNDYENKSEYIRELENYDQYVQVLNELIFSLSVDTTYKLVSQIKLNLINTLNEFKAENIDKFKDDVTLNNL